MSTTGQPSAHELTFEEWSTAERATRTAAVGRALGSRHRLHLRVAERLGAKKLLVLMPAAQSRIERGQINPLFSRWNWIGDYPDSHIIAVSDPALYHNGALSAAWYISPDVDVVREIAASIAMIRDRLSIDPEAVIVYGSSLGGFGAFAVAAKLVGAQVVAEIPQIDVQKWPVPSALKALDDHVTGMPLDDYRAVHPEQLDIVERFKLEGRVPEFTLITNPEDHLFEDHLQFLATVHKMREAVSEIGRSTLIVEDRVSGHRVLEREQATALLRGVLAVF